jgi:hypothetical protein
VARHGTNGSFGAAGVSVAVIAALGLIGVFAAVVASCGGQSVTSRLGDPRSSGSPVSHLTTSSGSVTATDRLDAGAASSSADVSTVVDPPVVAAAPAIAPTPAPGLASAAPAKSLVLTSTRPSSSGTSQYVTPGAACTRAGAIGFTSAGKRAICWTNSNRKLVWIVF